MQTEAPPEILAHCASFMDGFTLASWRNACRRNYAVGGFVLRRDVRACMTDYVYADIFRILVTEFHGFIIGLAALSLVLREPSVKGDILSMAISDRYLVSVTRILREADLPTLEERHYNPSLCITAAIRVGLTPKLCLCISFTRDANPLCVFRVAPSSIFMHYASMDVIGCLYPLLTRRRLALLRRPHSAAETDRMTATLRCSRTIGFSFAFHASAWIPSVPRGRRAPPCYAKYYLCPAQARQLTDGGSFTTSICECTDRTRTPCVQDFAWVIDARPSHFDRLDDPTPEPRAKSAPPSATRGQPAFFSRQHAELP